MARIRGNDDDKCLVGTKFADQIWGRSGDGLLFGCAGKRYAGWRRGQ
ncbi:hypothetical protein [Paracoccus sp. MKU1]|nr:hypothetical protein [Paracoccus sp. MKU1]